MIFLKRLKMNPNGPEISEKSSVMSKHPETLEETIIAIGEAMATQPQKHPKTLE